MDPRVRKKINFFILQATGKKKKKKKMRACDRKTEKSNADVGSAEFHAINIGQIWRFPPEISFIIAPAVDLDPAYSCPATLALMVLYWRYNIYAPLFYLSLVEHRVDGDDDRKTMTMLAPELAEGSPFRDMSAGDLLEEIRKGQGLLMDGLWERSSELKEELKALDRRKRFSNIWLSVALGVFNLTIIVAAITVDAKPAFIAAFVPLKAAVVALIVSATAVNLLAIFAIHAVYSLLGVTGSERDRLLEKQEAAKVMIQGTNLAGALPRNLEQIGTHLSNLNTERSALRAAVANAHQVDQGGGGVGQAAAALARRQRRFVSNGRRRRRRGRRRRSRSG